MKKIIFALCLIFFSTSSSAETLTYEGKVIAEISRNLTLPFPALVDALWVSIGDKVRKGEKLLTYSLEAREARLFQSELMTGGAQADLQIQKTQSEQDLVHGSAQSRTAAELAARGLGSKMESAKAGRLQNLARQRLDALDQKIAASRADFSLRLEELESYFGSKLKKGDKLPSEFFLTAPICATVVNISPQARQGGKLEANSVIMNLAVLNPIQIQIQAYESEISRIKQGMPVTVEAVNINGLKLPGKVAMLSWQPTDNTIAVPSFYFAYIDVENQDDILKPGYKVLVHISTEE